KSNDVLVRTGLRFPNYENHTYSGRFIAKGEMKRLEVKINAKADDALLTHTITASNDHELQEANLIEMTHVTSSSNKWKHDIYNPEINILHLRRPKPL